VFGLPVRRFLMRSLVLSKPFKQSLDRKSRDEATSLWRMIQPFSVALINDTDQPGDRPSQRCRFCLVEYCSEILIKVDFSIGHSHENGERCRGSNPDPLRLVRVAEQVSQQLDSVMVSLSSNRPD
jgi:hypothetical protein